MYCGQCGASNDNSARFCSRCGRALASSMDDDQTELGLPAGKVLLNRFRIERTLGIGGMGRVYLAEDQELQIPVALKVMREELSHDAGSVARLRKEARAAIRLSHPNIVRLHDYHDDGGRKFLAMEYIDGEALAERLAREGTLSEEEARRITVMICRGLEHAHENRVIHRDLKPGNILPGKNGSIKIADFGIARIARDSMSRLTAQPDSGTFPHMSPEQPLGESSETSDLYSLGIVLYEMLSGEPPFHSGDVAYQIRNALPKKLDGISPELNAIVMKCLEKKPEARFASISELRDALEMKSKQVTIEAVPSKPLIEVVMPIPREEQVREDEGGADIPGPPANPKLGTIWWSPIDGCEMVWIPSGIFMMGSPKSEANRVKDETPHTVRIDRGFWMDSTEVTNESYREFVLANPQWQKGRIESKYHDGDYLEDWNGIDFPSGKARHPVIYVSWHAARAYSEWAGKRLPTEAEWEYAARGGVPEKYYGPPDSMAWYGGNSGGKTHPVKGKQPNRYGLYDMIGNVWEWCEDWYEEKYYQNSLSTDPKGPDTGQNRVLRGGSWYTDPKFTRVSLRYDAGDGSSLIGFRCARERIP